MCGVCVCVVCVLCGGVCVCVVCVLCGCVCVFCVGGCVCVYVYAHVMLGREDGGC